MGQLGRGEAAIPVPEKDILALGALAQEGWGRKGPFSPSGETLRSLILQI